MAVRPLPRRYRRGGGGAVDIFKNHRGSGAVAVDLFWSSMRKYMIFLTTSAVAVQLFLVAAR